MSPHRIITKRVLIASRHHRSISRLFFGREASKRALSVNIFAACVSRQGRFHFGFELRFFMPKSQSKCLENSLWQGVCVCVLAYELMIYALYLEFWAILLAKRGADKSSKSQRRTHSQMRKFIFNWSQNGKIFSFCYIYFPRPAVLVRRCFPTFPLFFGKSIDSMWRNKDFPFSRTHIHTLIVYECSCFIIVFHRKKMKFSAHDDFSRWPNFDVASRFNGGCCQFNNEWTNSAVRWFVCFSNESLISMKFAHPSKRKFDRHSTPFS